MLKKTLQLFALTLLAAAATVRAESGFGRFHALVIGNQNYTKIKPLKTPIADAKAVAEVLEKQYGFTVELLLDATDKDILTAVSNLRKTMTKEDDSLLIYYAGHGFLDKQSGVDYWQPVNAARDNDVDWVPTSRITDQLRGIQVRHVLIVADSCYSGSMLSQDRDSGAKLASGMEQDEWLRRVYQKRSRTALTSGGEEPVADGGGSGHSVFAKAFLDALRENKKILDGDGLFEKIKRPVTLNADQTPLYSDLRKSGHEMGGDFLLVPKELHGTGLQKQPERRVDLSFLQRDGSDSAAALQEHQHQNADQPKGKTIGQYIDHGDGTITDTKTRLMWKRCAEGLFGVNCENGKVERYTLDDAVKRFKNVKYARYSDWRLPTVDELKTLVQCSKGKDKNGICNDGSEKPTINQQAFPNTEETRFWSASYADNNPGSAWVVSFSNSYSGIYGRSHDHAVRLVRGGVSTPQPIVLPPPVPPSSEKAEQLPQKPPQNAAPQKGRTIGQYIDHGDGTITDTKTGLMWKRCSEGFSDVNCENGKIENYTWNDAVQRLKNVEYAGYKDWRMPTIDELKTLVYCSKGEKYGGCNEGSIAPTINRQAFPNTAKRFFWSGSPRAGDVNYAWIVYFNNGDYSIGIRSIGSAVRLVRGGQ